METFIGVTNCSTAVLQILKNYCNILNRHKNNPISNTVISKIIVSDDKTGYLVIREGWKDTQRIHSLIFDAEIRNNKIWLHHDSRSRHYTRATGGRNTQRTNCFSFSSSPYPTTHWLWDFRAFNYQLKRYLRCVRVQLSAVSYPVISLWVRSQARSLCHGLFSRLSIFYYYLRTTD